MRDEVSAFMKSGSVLPKTKLLFNPRLSKSSVNSLLMTSLILTVDHI